MEELTGPKLPENAEGDRITRAHLESLTTGDLITMADNLGVDIPVDLDRIFIIEELLEISSIDSDGSGDPEPADMVDTVFVESVPLPKQYNITFIEVMIRDPLWAFVFWEIKSQEKEAFEKAQDFDGYYLKVIPSGKSAGKEVFTVPVKPEDTAWYLGLSENGASQSDHQYTIELCVSMSGEETVLAVSSPAKLPELPELPAAEKHRGGRESPLIRLSGYGDFHVLRKNERTLRSRYP
jgi:hypothetical protein